MLKLAQDNELELRKAKCELEEAKRALELNVTRQIDAERQSVRDAALAEAAEEYRLKDAEKDHKLQEAMKVNDELRRKLQQGEVAELELEQILHDSWPFDEILPVPRECVAQMFSSKCIRAQDLVAAGSCGKRKGVLNYHQTPA